MKVSFRGRVIETYKSADSKYPGTLVTIVDKDGGGQVKINFSTDLEKKVSLDGLYNFEGTVMVRVASNAFGAVRLSVGDGFTVAPVKE